MTMAILLTGASPAGTIVQRNIGANADNGGVNGVASPLGDKLTIQTTNIFKGGKSRVSVRILMILQRLRIVLPMFHTTLKAMLDQMKNGATVINCSFGPSDYTQNHNFNETI